MDYLENELAKFELEKIKLENKIIQFGKYKDKTVKYLFENDIEYVLDIMVENTNVENTNKMHDDILNYINMCATLI